MQCKILCNSNCIAKTCNLKKKDQEVQMNKGVRKCPEIFTVFDHF